MTTIDEPSAFVLPGASGLAPETGVTSAVAALRAFIQDQRLKPGMKLPSERTLAAELKIGRPALRESIKALSMLGAIESRRGDGTYIKSTEALAVGWPAAIEIEETAIDLLELLELRKIVEPPCAALAASRASVEDLRRIEQVRASMEEAGADWKEIGKLDFALHELIVAAAGNAILEQTYRYLKPLLLASRDITARTAPNWDRMKEDHREIVAGLIRREPEHAERAMTEHLHHVGFDLIGAKKR